MTREEMRERVAALLNADCFEGCEPGPDEMRACVYPPCRCRTVADAAISLIRAEVLEEAARCADRNAAEAWQEGAEETRGLMRLQAADIAAVIRALKEKP